MRRAVHDDISIPSPTYRVPRRRGMDPATRRLAVIAAGIAGAFVLIAGGWSMLGGRPSGVPVLQAPPGPVRVKPANPGGLQVAGVGNAIFSGGSGTTVDRLAPPPEVPDPQALRPSPPPPAMPAAAVPAASPPPAAARAAALPLPPPAPPSAVAAVPPPPVAMTRAAAAVTPVAGPTGQPAAAASSPRVAATTPAQAGRGTTLVQLAALSTEAGARTEWRDLSRRLPHLLRGRHPVFSRVDDRGHIFWRVRTGGFADQAEARRFCDRVRRRGLACSVADF